MTFLPANTDVKYTIQMIIIRSLRTPNFFSKAASLEHDGTSLGV